MKVAFHVDQLWFSAPGGIGTYVWELLPALADEDPSVDIVPFRSAWDHEPPKMWLLSRPPVVIPRPIRTLYPSWDLLGRPGLPPSLADAAVVHATNPAAVPPWATISGSSSPSTTWRSSGSRSCSRAIGAGSTGPGCARR